MGQEYFKPIKYNVLIGEKKPGETQIIRSVLVGDKQLPGTIDEGIDTLWKVFERSVRLFPNNNCIGTREKLSKDTYGKYTFKTYSEINEEVINYATGIVLYGLCPEVETKSKQKFKFYGIYSRNREEWMVSDIASHMNSISLVTFYDTLGDSTIEFILSETNLTTIGMESDGLKKINKLKEQNKVSNLQNLILFDNDNPQEIEKSKTLGFNVYTFNQVVEKGKGNHVEFTHCKPETLATLSYTSGTTGVPKGTMLTHSQIAAQVTGTQNIGIPITDKEVYLSFLPLAHVFERVINLFCMYFGALICFYSGSPRRLLEDSLMCKPTVFVCVPRIAIRIYDTIMDNIKKKQKIAKELFHKALKEKITNLRLYGKYKHPIYDKLIFNKTKAILGGRCKLFVIGGAPISREVCEFIRVTLCTTLLLGYGQTETCGAAMISNCLDNIPDNPGGVIPAIEMKLVDCPELNYTSEDINPETHELEPRGEICVRGPAVFKAYLNDEENTVKSFDSEGWLHSGDVGVILMNRGNAVKIIDRVKSIFKLSQGEYIAPEKIENELIHSKYVKQIWVTGISTENYIVGVVVPEEEECIEFLNQKNMQVTKDNFQEYIDNKDLIKEIIKDLDTTGRQNGLKGFELVKNIILFVEGFNIENNLCTPTLKLKRPVLQKKFEEDVKNMYKK